MQRAERHEECSRRLCTPGAKHCRSVMSKNQARARTRPRPTSSAAKGLGGDLQLKFWIRQHRLASGKHGREAATPHSITSQCLHGSFQGKISEGGPEQEPQRPEPEAKARAVIGHVEQTAHSSRQQPLTTAADNSRQLEPTTAASRQPTSRSRQQLTVDADPLQRSLQGKSSSHAVNQCPVSNRDEHYTQAGPKFKKFRDSL